VGEMLNVVVQFFQQDGWPFTHSEEQMFLRTGFQGENGQWNCYAHVREEQAQFIFYSVCPVKAPEAKRPALAEFLTRANYGLYIGNFELDFDDGEARFKTSLGVEGEQLTLALVQQMVYANVLMMDRYLPGILRVVYGDAPPAEAIAEIEN